MSRQSSLFFPIPHFRFLSPLHSSTELQSASSVPGTSSHRATAQVSVQPPLTGAWGSPLCNLLSRVRAPTQAPASTDKPLECFPADFWVMAGRTVAGRAQASRPDWCRWQCGRASLFGGIKRISLYGYQFHWSFVLRTRDLPLTQFRLQFMWEWHCTGPVSTAQRPLAPASLGREHPWISAVNLGGEEKPAFTYAKKKF